VWGFEFTTKAATLQGGSSEMPAFVPAFFCICSGWIGIWCCACCDWPFSSASKPIDLRLGFQVHWGHIFPGFPASTLVGAEKSVLF
jgi:hypothetical protein